MMRYIKLFEGFEDEYYYQISYPEEMKLYNYDGKHGNKEIFTIEEINWLKDNLVINGWLYGMGKYSYQLDNLDPWGCRFNPRGKVYKLRDEWFVVEFMRDEFSKKLHATITSSLYYKCDQFEGLVELLKDKGVIE